MDHNDRKAIEDLFGKLSAVEGQSGPRDAEAERFIQDRVRDQPAAPYLMAQTIVMQEMALENQHRELEALRRQAQSAPQGGSGGGFLSRMFGGGDQPQQGQRPAASPTGGNMGAAGAARPAASGPWGGRGGMGAQGAQPGMAAQGGRGGGFLAGAAQTAVGVAGGVLLGNALGSMFTGGDEAQAAEAPADEGMAEPAYEETAMEDDGGGFFDDGGFDEI